MQQCFLFTVSPGTVKLGWCRRASAFFSEITGAHIDFEESGANNAA